ncbi:MAG: S-adenosylmethionine decarboxylase [Candidatus Woesebacteria bacterium]|nr:MAG: S-adenosylmethionine decarboxylase [Candidatus Woesebacteria bacterium]
MTFIQDNLPLIYHFIVKVKFEEGFQDSEKFIEEVGTSISKILDITIVKKDFHKFEPHGITYIFILSQSHLVIHTYPEYNLIHIDLLSCKKLTKDLFEDALKAVFRNQKFMLYY